MYCKQCGTEMVYSKGNTPLIEKYSVEDGKPVYKSPEIENCYFCPYCNKIRMLDNIVTLFFLGIVVLIPSGLAIFFIVNQIIAYVLFFIVIVLGLIAWRVNHKIKIQKRKLAHKERYW